ncbi:hypothetical protein Vafri_2474, partial [Volvox africanus]
MCSSTAVPDLYVYSPSPPSQALSNTHNTHIHTHTHTHTHTHIYIYIHTSHCVSHVLFRTELLVQRPGCEALNPSHPGCITPPPPPPLPPPRHPPPTPHHPRHNTALPPDNPPPVFPSSSRLPERCRAGLASVRPTPPSRARSSSREDGKRPRAAATYSASASSSAPSVAALEGCARAPMARHASS